MIFNAASSIVAPQEVFIATYGTTTYSDVLAAFNAGKAVFCKNGNQIIPMNNYNSAFSSIVFNSFEMGTGRRYTVNSSGWSSGTLTYVNSDRTINGKALSSNITLSASDVGALPSSTTIPTKVSELQNDSGFITSYTETDPVFTSSAAYGISSSDITNWNGKTSNTGTVTSVTLSANSPLSIDSSSEITTSGSRTLSHNTSGVTAGTYNNVTVNTYGHVTSGSSVSYATSSDVGDLSLLYVSGADDLVEAANTVYGLSAWGSQTALTLSLYNCTGTINGAFYYRKRSDNNAYYIWGRVYISSFSRTSSNPGVVASQLNLGSGSSPRIGFRGESPAESVDLNFTNGRITTSESFSNASGTRLTLMVPPAIVFV